jgi:hypothetical protein
MSPSGYVSYSAFRAELPASKPHLARSSWLRVEGKAPQALRVAPTPSTDVNVLCPNMGLLNGAEAYHIDPRFNRGVSVTLTPSATVIKRNFDKEVFKPFYKGAIHPRLREARFFAPLTPIFYNRKR